MVPAIRIVYLAIRIENKKFSVRSARQGFKLPSNGIAIDICLGGGDYAYSAAYSQYSSAPYSGYGYGAATSGLLSK